MPTELLQRVPRSAQSRLPTPPLGSDCRLARRLAMLLDTLVLHPQRVVRPVLVDLGGQTGIGVC